MQKVRKRLLCVIAGILIAAAVYAVSADTTVYVADKGEKHHRETCRFVHKSKRALTLGNAVKAGYTPCKVCKPSVLEGN